MGEIQLQSFFEKAKKVKLIAIRVDSAYVTKRKGGEGAVREVIEIILAGKRV